MFKKRNLIICVGFILFSGFGLIPSSYAQKKKSDSRKEELNKVESTDKFTEGVKYYILEDLPKALLLFQKSLEYDPNNDAAYYQIAKILNEKEEFGEALGYAAQALALNPQNKYYYLLDAEILTRQSNFKEAAEVYETMISKVKGADEHLFELAALYLYQKEYNKALEIYSKAENIFGLLPEIIYQKQKVYLQMNKLDKAIEAGDELVKTFPGEPTYVMSLAEILVSNGKDKEAIPYLENLLEVNPEVDEARLFLAKIYQNTGKPNKAAENFNVAFANADLDLSFKKDLLAKYISEIQNKSGQVDNEKKKLVSALTQTVVETHPDQPDAYVLRGDYLVTVDSVKEARDTYLKALAIDENNYAVWQNVINIEFTALNEPDSVIEHTEDAIEIFPNQAILYFYNGASQVSKKNYEEAIFNLEQGQRLASNNPELLGYFKKQLAYVYNEDGDFEKSDQLFTEVLEANPNDDESLNNYSYFLALRQEKLDEALKMSTKLIRRNPENATYLDTHAWVLYMAGKYQQAKEMLERALSANEGIKSGEIIEHYGDVLFKLGDVDEAVKQWKRAKGMNDSSELLNKKIADRKLYEE